MNEKRLSSRVAHVHKVQTVETKPAVLAEGSRKAFDSSLDTRAQGDFRVAAQPGLAGHAPSLDWQAVVLCE